MSESGVCIKIAIDECAIYDSTLHRCLVCFKNKQVTKDGNCTDGIFCDSPNCQYCEKVGGNSSCVLCDANYMLLPNGETKSCIKEPTRLGNCELVKKIDDLKCEKCDAGYFLSLIHI